MDTKGEVPPEAASKGVMGVTLYVATKVVDVLHLQPYRASVQK